MPRDSALLSLLCGGEGFHNYHHTFPWDYSTSEWGTYCNVTTAFLDVMWWMGLAKDLKVPPVMVIIIPTSATMMTAPCRQRALPWWSPGLAGRATSPSPGPVVLGARPRLLHRPDIGNAQRIALTHFWCASLRLQLNVFRLTKYCKQTIKCAPPCNLFPLRLPTKN